MVIRGGFDLPIDEENRVFHSILPLWIFWVIDITTNNPRVCFQRIEAFRSNIYGNDSVSILWISCIWLGIVGAAG